jgi:hypothetical protein
MRLVTLLAVMFIPSLADANDPWVRYEGGDGPGQGKKIVLVSGDEEYRSEEAFPMLAQILSERHGFETVVLFAINPETGEIDPNYNKNIPGLEQLVDADLMMIATRWRDLPGEQVRQIDDYLKSGRPVIGLRTATHALKPTDPEWVHYADGYRGPREEWHGGFGRVVLGEMWINHHGKHGAESTRGILLGQVVAGMKPTDPPVEGDKNDPMMPIAWTKSYQISGGQKGQSFTTTMGSSMDLQNEALRRLIVNAVYYLLDLEIPEEGTDVRIVGDYQPTPFGFGQFQRGRKPADFANNVSRRSRFDHRSDEAVQTRLLEPYMNDWLPDVAKRRGNSTDIGLLIPTESYHVCPEVVDGCGASSSR